MTDYYLRSADGSDASDGLTWANAFATLLKGITTMAAGDNLFVADAHDESAAGDLSLDFSIGTPAAPLRVLCVDDTGDPEPPTALATGAKVGSGGGSGHQILFGAGYAYIYGIEFLSNRGGTSSTGDLHMKHSDPWIYWMEQCKLNMDSTSSAAMIQLGTDSSGGEGNALHMVECILEFSNVAQTLFPAGTITMVGGSIIGNQTALITLQTGGQLAIEMNGVDLSALVSGDSLVDVGLIANSGIVDFLHCKLGAAVALTTGTWGGTAARIRLIGSDSADTNYRYEEASYQGDLTTETTIIRTGGASDGTTGFSHKMVSSAGPEFFAPMHGPWINGWIDSTGSKTIKAQIVHDSVTNLQDDEVWIEVDYQSATATPEFSRADDRMADIFATAADQSLTGDTWTTTGMTNPNTQDLSVTKTVNEKGNFRARVVLAKPSYTIYACPKIEVT